jgi:arginase
VTAIARPRDVHVIGVPLDLGAGRRGVDMGPSAFRIAGLADAVQALGWGVVDRGNIATPVRETLATPDPSRKYLSEIAGVCGELRRAARDVLAAGGLPLVLGGDHSLAAGSVAAGADWVRASQGLPLGVIWVDAHGDMNTPLTSTSGNVHGMPLAALLGRDPHALVAPDTGAVVHAEHTILVGVRNLDAREKAQIQDAGVQVFTMKDIDREGMARIAERAIAAASNGTGGIHVSFDLDACDPTIAPGVGTPVRGGLAYREAHLLMELVADSGRLIALDLVEVNPTLDVRNGTAELGVELALSALGKSIL